MLLCKCLLLARFGCQVWHSTATCPKYWTALTIYSLNRGVNIRRHTPCPREGFRLVRPSVLIYQTVLPRESGVLCFPSPSSVSTSCLATERSTLQPTPGPKRSWMACWSPTPPRCTCCRPGWQVIKAPSLLPSGLSVTVCRRVLDLPVYRRSVCFP